MLRMPPPSSDLLSGASLFLDVDGTITEFVAPDASPDIDSATFKILNSLSKKLNGRIALISGRSLDNLIGLMNVSGLDLTGSHGLERRRADGSRDPIAKNADFTNVHRESRELGEKLGLLVEEKPAGAAFHYRSNPKVEREAETGVMDLADRHQLEFRRGKMVFEVRVPGPHKGDALRALMAEEPFRGGTPIFVGDDLTDEDGFAAARELGGHGVLVGEARETAAAFRLPSVSATLDWLSR